MAIHHTHPICMEFCDALGLKNVVSIDIHISVDDLVTVTAKYYPEIDEMKKVQAIIKKYKLELRE